ncbi:hypothetical protein M0R45_010429 [Rubus argutus]|uniref:Uncharacterized protein n=1 Tax=Rubus argutus TaxID=59490 RepID=A0AAW1Y701_RUBAR
MSSETPAYFTNILNNGLDSIDSVPINNDDLYKTSGYLSSEVPDMSYETPAKTSQTASTTKKAQRSVIYSIEEDLFLVSAWLYVSLDAVKGNEQKSCQYCTRIWKYFHEHKTFQSDREATSLQHHWGLIQSTVNKFVDFMNKLKTNEKVVRLNKIRSNEPNKCSRTLENGSICP